MATMLRNLTLQGNQLGYRLIRPVVFRRSAQKAHEDILRLLRIADANVLVQATIRTLHRHSFAAQPTRVGGVDLPFPLMLAAGFVKGMGFSTEADALQAVRSGTNIMPGWRSMPALVGPVEFGSFTPYPRTGNPGIVMWRDVPTASTQNRVGLKNPGASAAAAFLLAHQAELPPVYGINIAPSPGLDDADQERDEIISAFSAFTSRCILPSWFTLNLSCPNTEDDPEAKQTEQHAAALAASVLKHLREHDADHIPLWVKVSPYLSEMQYAALMRVFAEVGVKAVVATNTLPLPSPDDPRLRAGVGGGRLHQHALEAVHILSTQQQQNGYAVDVIGCGGAQDVATYRAFLAAGAGAVQYWSALVFSGPLAPALMLHNEAPSKG